MQYFTRIILPLALLLTLVNIGCIVPGEPMPSKVIPEAITLMISSNTVSNFTPCGCSSGKWGGMPRRGTIYNEVDDSVEWPFIPVDTGDVTQGSTSDIQITKDKFIFQAYGVLGYDCVNIGMSELRLGVDELRRVGDENNINWISCNTYAPGAFPDLPIPQISPPSATPDSTVRDPFAGDQLNPPPPQVIDNDNSEPGETDELPAEDTASDESTDPETPPDTLFPPYYIIEPEGHPGYKIAFLGAMIQDAGRLNPLRNDFSFEPYGDAIRRNVDLLRNVEKVDLIILLSDVDNYPVDIQEENIFEGIDIAIGGNSQLQRSPHATYNPLNEQYIESQAIQYMNETGQIVDDEGETETEPDGEIVTEIEGEPPNPVENIEIPPLDIAVLLVPKSQSRGRLVRRLDVFFDASGRIIDYYTIELRADETREDDPRMDEIARGYDTEVLSVELNNRVERRFTGSQACGECHPGYYTAWSDFGHLHSYASVENSETPMDRKCTRCHAIGYVEEPRLLTYDLIPEQLRNVGCEGCHQNGYPHITLQNHLANLSPENRSSVTTTDTMAVDMMITTCQKCHNGYHEWSPPFDFQTAIESARVICTAVE